MISECGSNNRQIHFRTIFARKKEQGGFSTVVTLLISPHLDMSALRRKYGIVFTVIGFALMLAGAIMGAYNLLK